MKLCVALMRKYWKPLLSILVVCALGIAVMTGLSGGYLTLENSLLGYIHDYGYPDAVVTTELTTRDVERNLAEVEGVDRVEARAMADTTLISPSGRFLSIRVFTCSDESLQTFEVWDEVEVPGIKGKAKNGDDAIDPILLEYTFARDNGIAAGDEVRVRVKDVFRPCVVTALVTQPETLSMKPLGEHTSSNPDFGFAYVDVSLLEKEPAPAGIDARKELDRQGRELAEAEKAASDARDQALSAIAAAQTGLDTAFTAWDEIRDELSALAGGEDIPWSGLSSDALKDLDLAELQAGLRTLLTKLEQAGGTLSSKRAELEGTKAQVEAQRAEAQEALGLLYEARDGLSQIDQSLATARVASEALSSEAATSVVNSLRRMSPGTELPNADSFKEALQEIERFCKEAGISLDTSQTPRELATRARSAVRTISQDRQVLNDPNAVEIVRKAAAGDKETLRSKEYAILKDAIARYCPGEDLTEATLSEARTRCDRLYALSTSSRFEDALSWLEKQPDLPISDYLAMMEGLLSQVDVLQRWLDGQTVTVEEVVSAYDEAVAALAKTIDELEGRRADIVAALASRGVDEGQVDGAIAELERAIAQADEGLGLINDALPQIDAQLARLENGESMMRNALDRLGELLASLGNEGNSSSIGSARDAIDKSRKSVETQWAEAVTGFAELHDELAKAYRDLDEWKGYQAFHNQFLLRFEEGADPDATLAHALDALSGLEIKDSYIYEDSGVRERTRLNLDPIHTLSYFMPILFFIVVLIVVFLFMSLIVRQCRREIGILRALGFSALKVRGLFCAMGLVVSLCATPLGMAIGWGIVCYVGGYFQDFFPLPSSTFVLDVPMALLSVLLTAAVAQLATLWGTRIVTTIEPSEAMSRALPSGNTVPKIVESLTRAASGLVKFSIVSLLRNKVRLVFSVICIAATFTLIVASFSFIASKNYMIDEMFGQRIHYDCQAFFSDEPSDETIGEINQLGFVSDVQPLAYYTEDISFGGESDEALVNALQVGTDLIGIYDSKGNRIEVPQEGIVLERHLAERLGAGIGDRVQVGDAELKVVAINDQHISRCCYVSLDQASILGEAPFYAILCRIDPADQQSFLEYLTQRDDYLYSEFTDVLLASMEDTYATYDLAAWIVIAFAIVIGLLVVFNITQTNLLEQKRELCVLRTLGFSVRELSRKLFSQSLVHFALACLVGIPAGHAVALVALAQISTPSREFAYANGPVEYLLAILIVFAYVAISHLISMRSVRKWDINEGTKEKE